jgi:integrase/recombinase XerD
MPENKGFFQAFRDWLKNAGYGESAIALYSVAVRQVMGFLDKPYWVIDPDADLERAREHIWQRCEKPGTRSAYQKGLLKLAEYLRYRSHRPAPPKQLNWGYYLAGLPEWLQSAVRDLHRHCQRAWLPVRQFEASRDMLSHLTPSLRWIAARYPLNDLSALTPDVWFAYLDTRLAEGINPQTTNDELASLRRLALYLQENGQPICERFLLVDFLEKNDRLPRDVPVEQLRLLLSAIQAETGSPHAGKSRTAAMDLAWFLLMLHCGLRTGEVRRLKFADIDWEQRRIRIEQSKGLKDRMVYFTTSVQTALQAYLKVRGPKEALPENIFLYYHQPLSQSYCFERLRTYAKRCGVRVSPHQLRHSCATLLLNAGAPVLAVQAVLGHKQIDTTLGYARLYDGTVASAQLPERSVHDFVL